MKKLTRILFFTAFLTVLLCIMTACTANTEEEYPVQVTAAEYVNDGANFIAVKASLSVSPGFSVRFLTGTDDLSARARRRRTVRRLP